MKRACKEVASMLGVSALLFAFFAVTGQAQTAAPVPAAAPAPAAVLVAKIDKGLSTKNAKQGDGITAKTVRAYKLPDGTDIPKGSKIVGKLDSVQSKKVGNGDSLMSFRLDQIEVKGGATVPIRGMVVAIGPAMAPHVGLGGNSVLARSSSGSNNGMGPNSGLGTGSSNGLDPNAGLGKQGAKDENDIAMGSTMDGVALGRHLDADWTTILKGIHTEIDLDSDVVLKVELK